MKCGNNLPAILLLSVALLARSVVAAETTIDGKEAFEANCGGCHLNGGNMLNPTKTLMKMSREANGVRTARDIVRKMRKPGPGMRAFTKEDIPDRTARAIADYIIATFK